jgi:hypothetical protein
MEHSNSIPDLIEDFKCTLHRGYIDNLLILMMQNLNERILELEKQQLLKEDDRSK